MIKVLFVCLGNICRSPIAEATFREIVKQKGLADKIECDSAGTAGYHIGQLPDHRTMKNAEKHGLKLTHKGRKISLTDLDDFNHIVVMDEQNFEDVYELYYKTKHQPPAAEKVFLLRDHDPETRGIKEVPDPYYESEPFFEEVYQIVWRSNEVLVEHLIDKYHLLATD
ncbi:protein tyrosine phosphatase [Emticicia oligotrophica DSM 17448]|uniref:protein-tyrosine-phosphatase n=1 Tax=Emticicia oligotrophica (strain DSM 17448 / CIP 109782 / MTCC 6937 / GPTSA100-15) TaxID=929562 RepID=A0ABN4ARU3_EMTOG|nr:low molecular weight protein-tyrosine-phosphatase [Emticicia oligotrophica]AFK04066.1 protein tyrosine phosphatase [Emticicia oligotrophica DSM 17448]